MAHREEMEEVEEGTEEAEVMEEVKVGLVERLKNSDPHLPQAQHKRISIRRSRMRRGGERFPELAVCTLDAIEDHVPREQMLNPAAVTALSDLQLMTSPARTTSPSSP